MKIICQTTLFFLVFVTNSFAQVGIGTTTPLASSALDVTATNKGLLVPRVALTGSTDTATIASPATSLLVYNTASAGTSPNTVSPGYYYFNGTQWERLTNGGANSVGAFTTATANGATITGGILQLAPASVDYGGIVNTDAQTFSGTKTFNVDAIVNGLTVGRGAGNKDTNSAFGFSAFAANTSGLQNNAIGNSALSANTSGSNNNANGANALKANTSGLQNNALGTRALEANTVSNYNIAIGQLALGKNNGSGGLIANGVQPNNSGNANIAIGTLALSENTNGHSNIGIGYGSLFTGTTDNTSASYVTALGYWSGKNNKNGSNNTYLGANTESGGSFTNSTALGNGASITASNTIQLGNSSITNVKTSGTITAGTIPSGTITYPNVGGTIGQVLTTISNTNGVGVAGWAAQNVGASSVGVFTSATANGATITNGVLQLAPASLTTGGIVTTNAQTFDGTKSFNVDAIVNGLTIGKGNGNVVSNTAIGVSAGALNASGTDNVSIGYNAGPSATFNNTISIGSGARATAANTMQLGNTSLSTINSSATTLNIGAGAGTAASTSLNINVGATGSSSIEVGNGRTGDGSSFVDFHSSIYNSGDYDARIIRNAGQNANWNFIQFGSEPIKFSVSGFVSCEIRNGQQVFAQNGFLSGSDKRIKKNIVTTKYGLNTIMKMHPVDYDLKLNDKKQVGFIAQEVKELVPELVDGFEGDVSKGEILSLNYNGITPILTKAIQEQQKEIDSLKAEIETLKALFAKEISKK